MKNLAAIFFLVCLTASSLRFVSATKCYVCTAATGKDSDCEKKVKDVTIVDCAAPVDACMTLIAAGQIVRSCGVEKACDLVDSSTYDLCKTCTSDLCNTDSSAFVHSYSTSLGVSIALFTLMKLFM